MKQIWNSANAVAIAVATVAVAILEYWQKRFRARYLVDCDMEFPNLEYASPRFSFILIFSYKRSTQVKEKRGKPSTKKKNQKETRAKQNSRARIKAALKENLQKSIRIQSFLFFSYCLVYSLIMGMYLMAETLLFIFLLQTMN